MNLPTQREIILNTITALEAARSSLSEARNWLHSEWAPPGSPLAEAAAEARSSTLGTVGNLTIDIETAKRLLYEALEQLGAQSAGWTGLPGLATDGDVPRRSV